MVRIKRFRYNLHEILYRNCAGKSNDRLPKIDTILLYTLTSPAMESCTGFVTLRTYSLLRFALEFEIMDTRKTAHKTIIYFQKLKGATKL